jgi:hypothetical protein
MKPVEFADKLWEPIRALPPAQRNSLRSQTHNALNTTAARIRNADPQYTLQLEKAEKETWYELSQLCEQYGVSMEPFYVQRRNAERLHEALKQPGAIRETVEMMGVIPRRNKANPYLTLFIIALLLVIILLAANIHP